VLVKDKDYEEPDSSNEEEKHLEEFMKDLTDLPKEKQLSSKVIGYHFFQKIKDFFECCICTDIFVNPQKVKQCLH
jgi:hypothetical protein